MKTIYLIKSIPLLSTLFLIIFFSISNNKENIKLKILIWNTPTFSVGSYLAASTGTGFLLSYIITNSLAKRNEPKLNKFTKTGIKSKDEISNDYIKSNNNITYDNTLIERDIRDPSPTIKASFRVIGNTKKINNIPNNVEMFNNELIDYKDERYSDHDFYEKHAEENEYSVESKIDPIENDWNDDKFLEW